MKLFVSHVPDGVYLVFHIPWPSLLDMKDCKYLSNYKIVCVLMPENMITRKQPHERTFNYTNYNDDAIRDTSEIRTRLSSATIDFYLRFL